VSNLLQLWEVMYETVHQSSGVLEVEKFSNFLRRLENGQQSRRCSLSCLLGRNSGPTARGRTSENENNEVAEELTNCFASALRIMSEGTPLNCLNGVMEPHLPKNQR
jgi:hypothetical protein